MIIPGGSTQGKRKSRLSVGAENSPSLSNQTQIVAFKRFPDWLRGVQYLPAWVTQMSAARLAVYPLFVPFLPKEFKVSLVIRHFSRAGYFKLFLSQHFHLDFCTLPLLSRTQSASQTVSICTLWQCQPSFCEHQSQGPQEYSRQKPPPARSSEFMFRCREACCTGNS